MTGFDQLRFWAETETGMNLSEERTTRLRDAVGKLLARGELRGTSLERLLAQRESQTSFLEKLTAELTVGETFFFRNAHHMRALREDVLPGILASNAPKREIRVWSAGCATGEEPYSVAILLDQLLAGQLDWQVKILATDLNPEFLKRARAGVYRAWSFRQTEIHREARYFTPNGDSFHLVPRVRDQVRFTYLNLVKDVYPSPLTGTLGLDLILFRNVAIYLKPEVTRAVIERFWHALRPGGWLLVGETELSLVPKAGFEAKTFDQATFYQKKPDPATVESPLPLPAPVLLPPDLPGVPSVPTWVPLPTPWARVSERSSSRPAATLGSSLWERIQTLLPHREFPEAERIIKRVSARKERAHLWLQYARALLACAEQSRAHQMLELCLQDNPLLLEAQLLRASFAEEAGNLAEAEQAYRQALYVDRKCPMAHFHLALVQQQKGELVGASRSVRTTLKLIEGKDPHAAVEYGEGICYGRLQELVTLLVAR